MYINNKKKPVVKENTNNDNNDKIVKFKKIKLKF